MLRRKTAARIERLERIVEGLWVFSKEPDDVDESLKQRSDALYQDIQNMVEER